MKENKLNREKILAKLNLVFRDVFDDESIEIAELTTASDIDEWDSISHINLIVAIEQEFSVKFTTKEVKNLENVYSLVEIIVNRSIR